MRISIERDEENETILGHSEDLGTYGLGALSSVVAPAGRRTICTGGPPGCARRGKHDTRRACNLVLSIVAGHYRIPLDSLRSARRGAAEVSRARQIAMYLVHTTLSVSYQDAAAEFARDRTTIAHACGTIEDARDSREFDAELAVLEAIIAAAADFAMSLSRGAIDGER